MSRSHLSDVSSAAAAPGRDAADAQLHAHEPRRGGLRTEAPVHPHAHAHPHPHAHAGGATAPFSLLRLSALSRLSGVSIVIGVLWAGVYWAMR